MCAVAGAGVRAASGRTLLPSFPFLPTSLFAKPVEAYFSLVPCCSYCRWANTQFLLALSCQPKTRTKKGYSIKFACRSFTAFSCQITRRKSGSEGRSVFRFSVGSSLYYYVCGSFHPTRLDWTEGEFPRRLTLQTKDGDDEKEESPDQRRGAPLRPHHSRPLPGQRIVHLSRRAGLERLAATRRRGRSSTRGRGRRRLGGSSPKRVAHFFSRYCRTALHSTDDGRRKSGVLEFLSFFALRNTRGVRSPLSESQSLLSATRRLSFVSARRTRRPRRRRRRRRRTHRGTRSATRGNWGICGRRRTAVLLLDGRKPKTCTRRRIRCASRRPGRPGRARPPPPPLDRTMY